MCGRWYWVSVEGGRRSPFLEGVTRRTLGLKDYRPACLRLGLNCQTRWASCSVPRKRAGGSPSYKCWGVVGLARW